MKARFLSFLMGAVIALSIFTLPVKKSEAAIVIISAAIAADNDYYYYGGGGCVFVGGSFVVRSNDAALLLALIFIVLDEKGQFDQSGVAQGLANNFPFIDNQAVLNTLAAKIAKIQSQGKTLIALPEAEVRAALLPAALAESEITSIVSYLK